MKNFDIENTVNPEFIETALIEVDGKISCVVDMDKDSITIKDKDSIQKIITDKDWLPIILDDSWLAKLNMTTGSKIKNARTNLDWAIRKLDRYYYLTIDKDISLGENPVIPLHYVHNLQEWYYRLTGNNLSYQMTNLLPN